jgi:hypothetical protein
MMHTKMRRRRWLLLLLPPPLPLLLLPPLLLLLLLLGRVTTTAATADVRMAVADLRPFPGVDTSALDHGGGGGGGGACADLFGVVTFSNGDVSADPLDAKLTVAATLYRADRCKDPANANRKLSVKLYPVGFSYTGATADTLAYFGSADGSAAVDLGLPAEAHPYTAFASGSLRKIYSATLPSDNFTALVGDLTAGSARSILGRAVVVSLEGHNIPLAAGIVGRRRPPPALGLSPEKNNIAGGPPRRAGQALVCQLRTRHILGTAGAAAAGKTLAAATSPAATASSNLVVSATTATGGVLVAARFRNNPAGYVAGTLRRLSLHRYAPVREGAGDGTLLANDTATFDLLGPVLSVHAEPPQRDLTLPCARGRRREGDLGNFAGDTYVAALDMLTGHAETGWAALVGSGCAVWKKAAQTCAAFPVGCNDHAGQALEAVGVLALSDDALSREFVLGVDVAQRRAGGAAAGARDLNYDCLGDVAVEATAVLYRPRGAAGAGGDAVVGTATLRQNVDGNGVSLTLEVPTLTDTHAWLGGTANDDGRANALSLQRGGLAAAAAAGGAAAGVHLGGTFQPRAGTTSRKSPPLTFRRSGDVGNLLRTSYLTSSTSRSYRFEYFYDGLVGESTVSLTDPARSVVGRAFAIHANADTFLGPDSNRGAVIAYGVLGINSPENLATAGENGLANRARGPDKEHAPRFLACRMRGTSGTTGGGGGGGGGSSTAIDGDVTLALKEGGVAGNLTDLTYVSAAATFQGLSGDRDYVLQIHANGDATGAKLGAKIGSSPTTATKAGMPAAPGRPGGTACHELTTFGYLGSIAAGAASTLTYLKAPAEGSLAEYTGRACVLSDVATGNVVSVGVLALPPNPADTAGIALEAASSWPKDITAAECRVAPEQDATLRMSDGKDGSVKGDSIPNNLGMVIGLSVGVPLLVLALAGGVYWHNHHQGTIEIKGRTRTLKKAVSWKCSGLRLHVYAGGLAVAAAAAAAVAGGSGGKGRVSKLFCCCCCCLIYFLLLQ